jgi:hypothetical protein
MKVVAIISSDKAKTQTYCKIQKLNEQVEQAYEKNDSKMADELSAWLGGIKVRLLAHNSLVLVKGSHR